MKQNVGAMHKRKDGRWCVTYYGDDGKRHFLYGKTKADLKQKLDEINCKKEVVSGIVQTDEVGNNVVSIESLVESIVKQNLGIVARKEEDALSLYKLAEWIDFYLENYKKNEIKQTTYDSYRGIYKKHILNSEVGKKNLATLTSDDFQAFYNAKTSEGYNAKTVRHIFILVNSALKKAVKLKHVSENVNEGVVLPKRKAYEGATLSVSEVKKIFKEAKGDELYPIIMLTICTGLRKGEVMSLKWENVNLEEKELYVEGNLCRVKDRMDEKGRLRYREVVLEPKTRKSRRLVPLTDMAVEALRLQEQRQKEMKVRYEAIYNDNGFVFTEPDGKTLKQRQFMDDYHAFLQKYGVADIRFHDLRHTFATLLLEMGESPKVIQELLGHSTITTTMDTYAHVSKAGKVKTVNKLEEIV